MMSTDTGYTMSSEASEQSHPPAQFFSADDILRSSIASDHPISRSNTYSHSNRDSVVLTTLTRASWVRRSYPILASTPVLVPVRAHPKVVTYGKGSRYSRPIPPLPELPPEPPEKPAKPAEVDRPRTSHDEPSRRRYLNRSKTLPARALFNYSGGSRLSTISSVPSDSSPDRMRPISREVPTPTTSHMDEENIKTMASPTMERVLPDLPNPELQQSTE
jgi:hypothetical protein